MQGVHVVHLMDLLEESCSQGSMKEGQMLAGQHDANEGLISLQHALSIPVIV
jgi:hypothetical protein